MKLTPSRLFGRFTRRSVRPTCLTAQRLLFAKVTLSPPFIPPHRLQPARWGLMKPVIQPSIAEMINSRSVFPINFHIDPVSRVDRSRIAWTLFRIHR